MSNDRSDGVAPVPAGERPLGELIEAGSRYLARRGVAEATSVCEWLAANLLGCGRLELLTHTAAPVGEERAAILRSQLIRVAGGEPVQYVLGEWDFRDLTLTVDRRALIPRPETEQLVDIVLAAEDLWCGGSPWIVDVGTGSGCIVLSLVHERPGARLTAIDISEAALALARENSERCGVGGRVEFRLGRGCGEFVAGSIDAIVSNPPYIASGVVLGLERHIRDHEPHTALDGGEDGLDIVREITRDAALVLRRGGRLFYEIGDDQGSAVRDILETHGFDEIEIREDLAGKTRFALARLRGL